MSRPAHRPRVIPFFAIEERFQLSGLQWGDVWYPAVSRHQDGTFRIRVVVSETRLADKVVTNTDYFVIAAGGEVTAAPRGYARNYRPGRVTGMAEAVAKYAAVTV